MDGLGRAGRCGKGDAGKGAAGKAAAEQWGVGEVGVMGELVVHPWAGSALLGWVWGVGHSVPWGGCGIGLTPSPPVGVRALCVSVHPPLGALYIWSRRS